MGLGDECELGKVLLKLYAHALYDEKDDFHAKDDEAGRVPEEAFDLSRVLVPRGVVLAEAVDVEQVLGHELGD